MFSYRSSTSSSFSGKPAPIALLDLIRVKSEEMTKGELSRRSRYDDVLHGGTAVLPIFFGSEREWIFSERIVIVNGSIIAMDSKEDRKPEMRNGFMSIPFVRKGEPVKVFLGWNPIRRHRNMLYMRGDTFGDCTIVMEDWIVENGEKPIVYRAKAGGIDVSTLKPQVMRLRGVPSLVVTARAGYLLRVTQEDHGVLSVTSGRDLGGTTNFTLQGEITPWRS